MIAATKELEKGLQRALPSHHIQAGKCSNSNIHNAAVNLNIPLPVLLELEMNETTVTYHGNMQL